MKKIFALLVFAIVAIACSNKPVHYRVPEGYKTCRVNADCPRSHYCGFVEVDSYAVCRRR